MYKLYLYTLKNKRHNYNQLDILYLSYHQKNFFLYQIKY